MIESIRYFLRKQRAHIHRDKLNNLAIIGDHFNDSNAYDETYILKCKIYNYSRNHTNIKIGNFCNISVNIFCNINAKIDMGDYVYMNDGCSLRADYLIKIGSHCMFGPRVIISDTDNHPLSRSSRHIQAEQIPYKKINSYEANGAPIIIEDDVWVCMDSLILGGVTIGYGAVVAAHSVVTKNVLPMTIVAGVPARVIGDVPD